eukprot:jgi/Mesvir1/20487/Mv12373-RA.1
MAIQLSKKRKFVADGVFYAELNELLTRELAEDGYSGVEVRVTPMRTEIIIRATRTQNVLGEKGRRIRELTSVVQKRFNFPDGNVELYAEKVNNRGLCAIAQAESLRYKLLGGLAVRRACYGVLRFIMESGAKGCEVIVSGKLRAQRAKSMKFKDGYMISSGAPVKDYIDAAVRHVMLRQGVLGIKVKIMLDWDPTGKAGPKKPLPDSITVHKPKEEDDLLSKPFIGKELERARQQAKKRDPNWRRLRKKKKTEAQGGKWKDNKAGGEYEHGSGYAIYGQPVAGQEGGGNPVTVAVTVCSARSTGHRQCVKRLIKSSQGKASFSSRFGTNLVKQRSWRYSSAQPAPCSAPYLHSFLWYFHVACLSDITGYGVLIIGDINMRRAVARLSSRAVRDARAADNNVEIAAAVANVGAQREGRSAKFHTWPITAASPENAQRIGLSPRILSGVTTPYQGLLRGASPWVPAGTPGSRQGHPTSTSATGGAPDGGSKPKPTADQKPGKPPSQLSDAPAGPLQPPQPHNERVQTGAGPAQPARMEDAPWAQGHAQPPPLSAATPSVTPDGSSAAQFGEKTDEAERARVSASAPTWGAPASQPGDGSAGGTAEPLLPNRAAEGGMSVLRGVFQLKDVPPVPLALGLAGAIPFVALSPVGAMLLPVPAALATHAVSSQIAYGASILSFLGAVHWGMAMASGGSAGDRAMATRYIWSVTPSLMAWTALLVPEGSGLAALILSLVTAYAVDHNFARSHLVPPWYLPLRRVLTVVATASLGMSFITRVFT